MHLIKENGEANEHFWAKGLRDVYDYYESKMGRDPSQGRCVSGQS